MVIYHSIRSEPEVAAEWLQRAIEHRDPLALIYTRHLPTLGIRESSLWPALARTLNLPEAF
jgi:hypothetical protein